MNTNRRDFIKTAGLGAAALTALRTHAGTDPSAIRMGRIIAPDKKLNIACIGCGGQGGQDVYGVCREFIVALCDVDTERAAGAL